MALFIPVMLIALTLLATPGALATPSNGAADPIQSLSAPAGNLVDNGSFESPDIPDGTFVEIPPGSLTDWSIDAGSIDLIAADYWGAPDGTQVLDIDGTTGVAPRGEITQDIPTTTGTAYTLGFVYSGNPDCGDIGPVAMGVYWGGALVGTVTHDTIPNTADRTVAAFDYQTFTAPVVGAAGPSTELSLRSNSPAESTCGIVIDDVYVVHASSPVWQGQGTGTTTVVNDGSTGAPKFSYAFDGGGGGATGNWTFYTTATTTGDIELDWSYTGLHAWFQVEVGLSAFVTSADGADTNLVLVDDGPVDCCTPPSNGFAYSGTTTLSVEPGDVYGFEMSGSNFDSNSFLNGTLTLGGAAPAPTLIRAISVAGPGAFVIGRVDGLPSTAITVDVRTAASCTDGVLNGAVAAGSPVSVTTDAQGYFGANVTGVPIGAYLAAKLTVPSITAVSPCIVSSGDNDFWPKALSLDGSPTANDVIDANGKARWYKFTVTPGQRIDVTLSGLPADYDLAVFKDIGAEFLQQLAPANAADLTKLSAEYAPSVFSPSVFSPSVFSPSVFSPDAYSPSVFSPSVFSPSVFSPSVFSPSVFSPSVFSPSVFSPSVFSSVDLAKAFSSAQTRSIIGVSATPGTGNETSVVNSWNNSGQFYVRVAGHAGAFSTESQFTINVAKGATSCGGVTDTNISVRTPSLVTGKKTIILADSTKLALGNGSPTSLLGKLNTFAARPEVAGVLVDVSTDARVNALRTQATNNASCPFAQNLVAAEIKSIVDSYRQNNAGLRYVVIAGGDGVIPFFRYPDQSLLGQESGYVPPVQSTSPSEASLRRDFVLSQDAYGAATQISLRTSDFPIPGLAVGRLVETPGEVAGMLDAYTSAGGVVTPTKSLVTGYDFLADAADAVNNELVLGTGSGAGTVHDSLITPNGKSPQDPASWTAAQLSQKLLTGGRHDVIFLAGHFSANSALAADFSTSLLTTDLAASSANLVNSIVFSAGCHAGYNLVDGDAVTGVTLALDWAQAFAAKQAVLIAGTGYQYGDTDFLEYSERLYRDFAIQLRAGTGAISIGEALVRAKLTYLASTPDIRGLHEKALLETTLFGLPMMGVNMPGTRLAVPPLGGNIDPVEVAPVNGTDLGLAINDLSVSPSLQGHSLSLKNPPYDALPGTFTQAEWLSGPNGTVTNPAEPALPLASVNVTAINGLQAQVLRGVGFRGGTYTDSGPIVPLTGAPTTELRGVHAPFVSPVFYPMKLWSPNYYGALGGLGGTNLLVTPTQHRADNANPGKSIRRAYSNLNLRLFYSSNLTTAALSDAPTIAGVQAQPNGAALDFSIDVVGDPKAFVHGVWITWTAGDGTWQSLDLQQGSDSRSWTGTLPSAPASLQYVVQAVNGLGLVSFDDNRGSYYQAAGLAAPADTTLTLISPPSAGTFGDSPVITAELKSGGTPVAGVAATISIGGSSVTGTTGANGRVSRGVPLNSSPGPTSIVASFGGNTAFGQSSASAPFAISMATSTLSAFTPQLAVVTPGANSGMTTTLSASVGGNTQTLGLETVTFTLTGPSSRTFSAFTDLVGKAKLPTTGLVAGTYNVTASFAGNATYAGATRTGTLVVSAFNGYLWPVSNPPKLNVAKAGMIIPLRFSLGGNRGLAILAAGSPVVTKITCPGSAPVSDVVPDGTWPNSGLIYISLIKQYVYVWKTPTSYKNSCYEFKLTFVDGTSRIANFRFK